MNKTKKLSVSICIPAYNEEKNAINLLKALTSQKTKKIYINKIVFISSGSTDQTNRLVEKFSKTHKKVVFIKENKRTGKAAAINLFLKNVDDPVVVLQSADTLPEYNTIENLCIPFLNDSIGLTGGAPYPTNNKDNFVGYIVHLWWWLHRNIPRYGEIIAFRNILRHIPKNTAVDEAYIQAWFEKGGYKLQIVQDAVVHNKGAETVKDIIIQRRRIFNGHHRLKKQIGYTVDSLNKKALLRLFSEYNIMRPKEFLWVCGGLSIELTSRLLGMYDLYIKNQNPFIWDQAKSTKKLKINTNAHFEKI